jgi:hypothetical protein
MPFQNAPAIVACGAKICRDESVVVRDRKKLGDSLIIAAISFCCYQYFEPCISFQRDDFHILKPCIFAKFCPLAKPDAVFTIIQDMLFSIVRHPFNCRYLKSEISLPDLKKMR